jgi:hypothetical protein
MMREPVATTQTRQVRVVANILTKDDFFLRRLFVWTLGRKKTEGSRKVCFSTLKVMTL